MILRALPKDQKIAVITANGPVLENNPAMENCGVTPEDKANRCVIGGCEDADTYPEFKKVLGQTGETFNVLKLEQEIVAATKKVVEENGNIGAVLLECTELPPAAAAVQEAVRRPVWDFTTLAKWVHDGCLRRKFTGWV